MSDTNPAKKSGGWVKWVVGVFALSALALCCGCAGLFFAGPRVLLGMLVTDTPTDLPQPAKDPGMRDQLAQRLAGGGEVRFTPEELTLAALQDTDDGTRFRLQAAGERATVDLSWETDTPGEYITLHTVFEAELEQGWFTHFAVYELSFSDHNLDEYLNGEELAANANQSLANQRAKDPRMAATLDEIEHLQVVDGVLSLTLKDGAPERLRQLSAQ